MIKLIATDMDGTFLDSNKRFDFEFIDIFYELKKEILNLLLQVVINIIVFFKNLCHLVNKCILLQKMVVL